MNYREQPLEKRFHVNSDEILGTVGLIATDIVSSAMIVHATLASFIQWKGAGKLTGDQGPVPKPKSDAENIGSNVDGMGLSQVSKSNGWLSSELNCIEASILVPSMLC